MMMKLTFEGRTLGDILDEMQGLIDKFKPGVLTADPGPVVPKVTAPVDKPVAKPVENRDKPVDKPKRARTEKQLANDEKMRVAALAKIEARKAAKAQSQAYATTLRNDLDRNPIEKPVHSAPEPVQDVNQPFAEPEEVDPAELVKLRTRTIEELQAAYANGHQKEVFELLSRFGNGAKSFRELPPESFMPIRRAIDLGALE